MGVPADVNAAAADAGLSEFLAPVLLILPCGGLCCGCGLDPGIPAATLKNAAQPGHLKLRELKRA